MIFSFSRSLWSQLSPLSVFVADERPGVYPDRHDPSFVACIAALCPHLRSLVIEGFIDELYYGLLLHTLFKNAQLSESLTSIVEEISLTVPPDAFWFQTDPSHASSDSPVRLAVIQTFIDEPQDNKIAFGADSSRTSLARSPNRPRSTSGAHFRAGVVGVPLAMRTLGAPPGRARSSYPRHRRRGRLWLAGQHPGRPNLVYAACGRPCLCGGRTPRDDGSVGGRAVAGL
jgi:hypothetical protein